jgi:hypothetical protein
MEQWEFYELTEATVARFLARMPATYVRGFESELNAGEYSMAVDDLVATLLKENVPVTADERDDLRRLVRHLKQPTDPLDRLTLVGQD